MSTSRSPTRKPWNSSAAVSGRANCAASGAPEPARRHTAVPRAIRSERDMTNLGATPLTAMVVAYR
jgi:hypothetical protein